MHLVLQVFNRGGSRDEINGMHPPLASVISIVGPTDFSAYSERSRTKSKAKFSFQGMVTPPPPQSSPPTISGSVSGFEH